MPNLYIASAKLLQRSQQTILRAQETLRHSQEVLRVSRDVQADREKHKRLKARIRPIPEPNRISADGSR